jgi:hypothetical protein
MDVHTIITLAMPIIVFLVTMAVTKIQGNVSGIVIVGIIVPLLSIGGAYLSGLLGGTLAFGWQVLVNFLAVFVNEFIKQIQQGTTPKP